VPVTEHPCGYDLLEDLSEFRGLVFIVLGLGKKLPAMFKFLNFLEHPTLSLWLAPRFIG
jgi:hypothetical protein